MPASVWKGVPPEPAVLRVLEAFGLSSVESVSRLTVGTGQERSLRVRADGDDWVLKPYAGTVDLGRLLRAHRWEEHLAEAGFPVAPLRRSSSGESLVTDGGTSYAVHGWVQGRQVSIADRDDLLACRPGLAGDLGAMVGTLHRISSEREEGAGAGADGGPDRLLRAPRHAVRALRRPRPRPPWVSRWRALRRQRDTTDFDRWIIQVLPEVAAQAGRLARQPLAARPGPLDTGLIHHDLNWENLVLDEELRPCALLDFDNSTRAPWMVELGSAAVVLAGTDRHLVEQFLNGYQSRSPFTIDPGLVRQAMELKCVQSILNSVLVYLDGDTDTTLREPWCRQLHAALVDLAEPDAAGPVPARLRGNAHGPRIGRGQQEEGHGPGSI